MPERYLLRSRIVLLSRVCLTARAVRLYALDEGVVEMLGHKQRVFEDEFPTLLSCYKGTNKGTDDEPDAESDSRTNSDADTHANQSTYSRALSFPFSKSFEEAVAPSLCFPNCDSFSVADSHANSRALSFPFGKSVAEADAPSLCFPNCDSFSVADSHAFELFNEPDCSSSSSSLDRGESTVGVCRRRLSSLKVPSHFFVPFVFHVRGIHGVHDDCVDDMHREALLVEPHKSAFDGPVDRNCEANDVSVGG